MSYGEIHFKKTICRYVDNKITIISSVKFITYYKRLMKGIFNKPL